MKLVTLLMLLAVLGINQTSFGKIVGKDVSYEADGITMKGYQAFDDSKKGPRPAVLVVHEWWGQNEYARKRANMLAELGYNALAIDMYGDGKTATHPKEAGEFSSKVFSNLDSAKARFVAAKTFIENDPNTIKDKVAAIGYCFGGGVVLHMARIGIPLKGVASFHGSLASQVKPKPGDVKSQVIVFHGADDKFIKPEDVENLKKEMKVAKADFEFISYPKAIHGFTNKDADVAAKKFNIPVAYQAKADMDSWAKMQVFLKNTFK